MGLNVRIYDIVSDGPYSIRYKSGSNPWPEYDDTTFTLYGTGLTATSIELTGLTFDTQYWIKMTDETTGRYIIQNIYTNDSKAFPCYDTICFSVNVLCGESVSPTPTMTPTVTSTSTATPTPTGSCEIPVIDSISYVSGNTFSISFTTGPNCTATEIGYSFDGVTWVNNTDSCSSPRLITLPYNLEAFIRIKQYCTGGGSSGYAQDVLVFPSPTPTPSPTSPALGWNYFTGTTYCAGTGTPKGAPLTGSTIIFGYVPPGTNISNIAIGTQVYKNSSLTLTQTFTGYMINSQSWPFTGKLYHITSGIVDSVVATLPGTCP